MAYYAYEKYNSRVKHNIIGTYVILHCMLDYSPQLSALGEFFALGEGLKVFEERVRTISPFGTQDNRLTQLCGCVIMVYFSQKQFPENIARALYHN